MHYLSYIHFSALTANQLLIFFRCLVLYTEETLNATDIVHIVVHFIGKFPELFAWFKNYVGYKDAVPTDQGRKNRVGELEINYASCKRYGASYRAHPPNYIPPKCMGRTELCKQVRRNRNKDRRFIVNIYIYFV